MISTHVLDTSLGSPAEGIKVTLQKKLQSTWQDVSTKVTNADGRIAFDCESLPGTYMLTFEIESYLKQKSADFFYLQAPVIFKIENVNRKYHVPLLLNPFGYSTYRGS